MINHPLCCFDSLDSPPTSEATSGILSDHLEAVVAVVAAAVVEDRTHQKEQQRSFRLVVAVVVTAAPVRSLPRSLPFAGRDKILVQRVVAPAAEKKMVCQRRMAAAWKKEKLHWKEAVVAEQLGLYWGSGYLT